MTLKMNNISRCINIFITRIVKWFFLRFSNYFVKNFLELSSVLRVGRDNMCFLIRISLYWIRDILSQ